MAIATVLSVLSLAHKKTYQKLVVINGTMCACVLILVHVMYLGPKFAFC